MRTCEWCLGNIRRAARRDAKCCSKKCRQAKHRFRVDVAPASIHSRRMRFGYADPPYPGLAHYYVENQEVNHRVLIGTLQSEYPDGWALSTSAEALAQVLALCPDGVRVGAWVKGARNAKCKWPAKSWEPVIVYRGRPRRVAKYSSDTTVNDSLVFGGRQHSHPGALIGMKPAQFAEWVFRMLGAEQGDQLDDLFPGSGAIGRAWALHMRDTGTSATRRCLSNDASWEMLND